MRTRKGVGLRRELHRLLRRGRHQYHHQQGSHLPQRRPQVYQGQGGQNEVGILRDTSKYTTFDDEGSSSEKNDDFSSAFANLIIK
jgi:hypothetical protein